MGRGVVERAKLLDATQQYLLANPSLTTTLSELARSIGSNNRMLLYYFGSLSALLAEAVSGLLDQNLLLGSLTGVLDDERPLGERLDAAWRQICAPDMRSSRPTEPLRSPSRSTWLTSPPHTQDPAKSP